MTTQYELYFNEEYALKHNPSLIVLGATGGYGVIRAHMRLCVEDGDMPGACIKFFALCQQTYKEIAVDALEIGCTVDDLLNDWFKSIKDFPDLDANQEIVHYLRLVVMEDTPMDLNPDPMRIPTLATHKSWGGFDTYAQDLRQFIEYLHDGDPDHQDPMDPQCIY